MSRWTLALFALLILSEAHAVRFRDPVIGDKIITAYFDQGGRSDWNCGDNTYTGHRGTDFGIIGRFEAMDQGRDVVAAASGEVIRTHDGEFDRCTSTSCGSGYGNYVAVDHGDGVVTYYGHLRDGSVGVVEGEQVSCGDYLGQVGSSGSSTGPHLHFEVRVWDDRIDPFHGPCNGRESLWVDQGAYNGLPSAECEDEEPPEPPAKPDFYLASALHLPDRDCLYQSCEDFARGGRSGGVDDAWIGEEIILEIIVENRGEGFTSGESDADAATSLRYAIPEALAVERYLIETDYPAYDQRTWARNDAMDNAHNPVEGDPGGGATLRLNGFSPGESKRVRLWLTPVARTVPHQPAELRAWINHVRDYYGERDHWDDPVEVNDGQTFNGGDLRVWEALDVLDPEAFLFDSPDRGFVEGWRACDAQSTGALEVIDGALSIEVLGATPCVESPIFAAAAPQAARLSLEGLSGGAYGELFWATAAEPRFDPARYARFALEGGATDLLFEPGWSGELVQLRIRPEINASGEFIRLREVRLVDEAAPPAPDIGVIEPPEPEDMGVDPRPDAAPWPDADSPRPDVEPWLDAAPAWLDAAPPRPITDTGLPAADEDSGAPQRDAEVRPTDAFAEGGAPMNMRATGGCQSVGGRGVGGAWLLCLALAALRRRARRG